MIAQRARYWAAALILLPACASGPRPETTDRPRVAMTLETADGTTLELARLRGRPVLLFVFTTFDEACQLALIPLSRFSEQHPDLLLIGVAAQPDPGPLLELYASTLDVRFPLAHDPEDGIVAGRSALGPVEVVPSYLLLNARGELVGRHAGAATVAELDAFTRDVLP